MIQYSPRAFITTEPRIRERCSCNHRTAVLFYTYRPIYLFCLWKLTILLITVLVIYLKLCFLSQIMNIMVIHTQPTLQYLCKHTVLRLFLRTTYCHARYSLKCCAGAAIFLHQMRQSIRYPHIVAGLYNLKNASNQN